MGRRIRGRRTFNFDVKRMWRDHKFEFICRRTRPEQRARMKVAATLGRGYPEFLFPQCHLSPDDINVLSSDYETLVGLDFVGAQNLELVGELRLIMSE